MLPPSMRVQPLNTLYKSHQISTIISSNPYSSEADSNTPDMQQKLRFHVDWKQYSNANSNDS